MQLPEELYQHEVEAKRIWDVFPMLDPSFSFLRRSTTRMAMEFGGEDFPYKPISFSLFPGKSKEEVNILMQKAMSRGVHAINTLVQEHIDPNLQSLFQLPELPESFDIHHFLKDAYFNYKSTITRDPSQWALLEAYAAVRAIELGYRVGMIDECPLVLNSVQHFFSVKKTLKDFLGFSNQSSSNREGIRSEWDTAFETRVYSYDEKAMHARVKYLSEGNEHEPKYGSILMKCYREGEFPEELKDYLGAEIIVRNNEERDVLISNMRRQTRIIGQFENYKNTRKKRTGSASSLDYGVIKFILRIPVEVERDIPIVRTFYERVPIEMQVLTLEDHHIRTRQTEVSHRAYKRRQFLEIFPALFPRAIYENF